MFDADESAEAGQTPLFSSDALLDWLPDETLFSYVSRLHHFWGGGLWTRTSELLFGDRRSGWQHDLPSGLAALVSRSNGNLGSADEIARSRTLFKYYRPFLDPEEQAAALSFLKSNRIAHLKLRLGILTSRFRANHPLKACVRCLDDDVRDFGWAYWHLEHQYPGVWWCLKHGEPLQESMVKSSGVERFLWRTPSRSILHDATIDAGTDSAAAFVRLARTTVQLVEGDATRHELAEGLPAIYRNELGCRGWILQSGNLRLEVVAAEYLEYCRPLRSLAELQYLPATLDESKAQVGRLLRPMRSGTHPLRHVLLIDWLFGGMEKLTASLLGDGIGEPGIEPAIDTVASAAGDVSPENQRKAALAELLNDGSSIHAAAKALSVETATAQAWAASQGFPVSRRPKTLFDSTLRQLISGLKAGKDKAELAAQCGVSVGTVTRILRTETGIQEAWHRARATIRRSGARRSWLRQVKLHGHLGTKVVRGLDPAAYAWLYRNDRDWLTENLPSRAPVDPGARASSVAWDERDSAMATAVSQAALKLASSNSQSRIYLWQLYQVVPELRAKLSVLHRLPLTKSAVERAIGRAVKRKQADDLFP